MTVYTPKPSAPEYINKREAFAALITGDATWDWLLDFLPFVDPEIIPVAGLCAAGPSGVGAISLVDLIPTGSVRTIGGAVQWIERAALLSSVAWDRLVGAYCQGPAAGGGNCWTDGPLLNVPMPNFGTNVWGSLMSLPIPDDCIQVQLLLVDNSNFNFYLMSNLSGDTGNMISGNGGTMQLDWYAGHPSGWTTGGPVSLTGASGQPNAATGNLSCQLKYFAPCQDAFVPTPQPEPPGLPAGHVVEPTLDGIAAELARHEAKLDWLQSGLQLVTGLHDLGGPAAAPEAAEPGTPVATGGAVGCVVTVSGVPAQLDVNFGTPVEFTDMGRVVYGPDDAWFAAVRLQHSPLIIRPFPAGTTRVMVTGLPPMVSSTIALIPPLK